MKITRTQLKQIIREEIRKVSKPSINEASFLDGFIKANPGYDPKKIIKQFSKISSDDFVDADDEQDHKEYVKNITNWFSKMSKKGPTVKVGDLVSVNLRSVGKQGIGKIVAATTMKGSFGFMGQVAPDQQPAWEIDTYLLPERYNPNRDIKSSKKPIEYKGQTWYFAGTVYYPQFEEGNKNAFTKLK